MNTALPRLILCADDFGISEEVDRVLLDLARRRRLSAVSCMSLGPRWAEDAPLLKETGVPSGLHVTLTQLAQLTSFVSRPLSEKALFLQSWARCLDPRAVEAEIRAQFERFISVTGAPPAFIDGHQHVHVLPVVRDAVLSLRAEYAPKAWVRNVADLSGLRLDPNYWILAVMGLRFRRMLAARGIPFNTRMRGQFSFGHAGARDFSAAVQEWGRADTLIYCHPGATKGEAEFLSSNPFGAMIGTTFTLAGAP